MTKEKLRKAILARFPQSDLSGPQDITIAGTIEDAEIDAYKVTYHIDGSFVIDMNGYSEILLDPSILTALLEKVEAALNFYAEWEKFHG